MSRHRLRNTRGVEIAVVSYGGIITEIRVPDRAGRLDDVALGFDSLAGYLGDSPYFGAIVGRFANRIARARFTLDGTSYQLAANNGPNHLHGGLRGFDKVAWRVDAASEDGRAIRLSHVSPDGDEGYPGRLEARVSYTLDDSNALTVDFEATADAPTPVNLTQHSYFNLAGAGRGDILGHELRIDADRYTPVDETLIPTGELAAVAGTPFDFRAATPIGARIGAADEQLRRAGGYDHNFVLRAPASAEALRVAAAVLEPTTGRTLTVSTTLPGLQFYSGNFLDGSLRGKGGRVYAHRGGFCLETQYFPDSPNQPGFPSVILRPGETHRSRTVFTFGVAD